MALETYLEKVNAWLGDNPVSQQGEEWDHVQLGYARSYHPRRTANEILFIRQRARQERTPPGTPKRRRDAI